MVSKSVTRFCIINKFGIIAFVRGISSLVERNFSKVDVRGPIPLCRSKRKKRTWSYNKQMKTILKYLFIVILLLSSYHFVRDILQTLNIHNSFTNIFHRPHLWCSSYCNYVTFPLDLLGIIGSFIVLKRNKLGIMGKVIIFSLPLWLLAVILP